MEMLGGESGRPGFVRSLPLLFEVLFEDEARPLATPFSATLLPVAEGAE